MLLRLHVLQFSPDFSLGDPWSPFLLSRINCVLDLALRAAVLTCEHAGILLVTLTITFSAHIQVYLTLLIILFFYFWLVTCSLA